MKQTLDNRKVPTSAKRLKMRCNENGHTDTQIEQGGQVDTRKTDTDEEGDNMAELCSCQFET